jgi:hypothetical protein
MAQNADEIGQAEDPAMVIFESEAGEQFYCSLQVVDSN